MRSTPTKSHQCCGYCPSFQILIFSVLFNACINVYKNNNDGNLNLIIFSLSYNNWLVFEIINVSSHLAAKNNEIPPPPRATHRMISQVTLPYTWYMLKTTHLELLDCIKPIVTLVNLGYFMTMTWLNNNNKKSICFTTSQSSKPEF